jgi:FMN phosphatase YigB (HAD superfamily)
MGLIYVAATCIALATLGVRLALAKKATFISRINQPISPTSTIITFDIHGVLFNPNWAEIFQQLWRNKKSLSLLIYVFNPWFIYDFFVLLKQGAVPEAFILHFAHKYSYFRKYKNFVLTIANTQKPIVSTIDLTKELKKKGYPIHIFSNIGAILYQDLAKKHPAIFNLFDAVYVPSVENQYRGKRHKKTFFAYLALCNPKHKQVIFVDNNMSNVKKADRIGIVAIRYNNTNELAQVFNRLHII